MTSRRPELRTPVLGTFAAVLVATVAIGYATGFRDTTVDEDVVMAASGCPSAIGTRHSQEAPTLRSRRKPERRKAERPGRALAGTTSSAPTATRATGVATVVRDADGSRSLTFTEFEVDPGAKVVVWLTEDEANLDDRIDLGGLKGNVGDQDTRCPMTRTCAGMTRWSCTARRSRSG